MTCQVLLRPPSQQHIPDMLATPHHGMRTRAATKAAAALLAASGSGEYTNVSPALTLHDTIVEASCSNTVGKNTPPKLTEPPTTELSTLHPLIKAQPQTSRVRRSRRFKANVPEQLQLLQTSDSDLLKDISGGVKTVQQDDELGPHVNPRALTEQKSRTAKRKHTQKLPKQPVRGGWDKLPHNTGASWNPSVAKAISFASEQASIIHGDVSVRRANSNFEMKAATTTEDAPFTTASLRLRPRKPVDNTITTMDETDESDSDAMTDPTKFGYLAVDEAMQADSPPKKRHRISNNNDLYEKNHPLGLKIEEQAKKLEKKVRRTKDNPYGLMPGETPYPDWISPTAQQCQEVYDILATMHGDVRPLPPDKIPAPSLEVAGCGEVPCILDGLIRTVLSGSTTFESADKMLQSLVLKFGVLEEGIGKGSVNWNNVRIADYDDVYAQLKDGGLGKVKATNIQSILNMVHDENMERQAALLREKTTGVEAGVADATEKTEGPNELEIMKADQQMLSLDHMHSMNTDAAIKHFVRYPGVGVKTAACVTLFSLQRPCFAVDTHVFRMSRWLGWVPPRINEVDTFGHLELRCPETLKYGLHQLFIRHGKTCYRCNDKSFVGTEVWNETECPLEPLLNRFTKRIAKPKASKSSEDTSIAKVKLDGQQQEIEVPERGLQ